MKITVIRDESKTNFPSLHCIYNFFVTAAAAAAAAVETESLSLLGIGCAIVNAYQIEFVCKLEAFLN